MAKARARVTNTDDYLAGLGADQRAALTRLRELIRQAAPAAEECISYQLPAFRQGKVLVGFGAATKHCSFYPMSSRTVEAFREELAPYDFSKGVIRFAADKPLPATLIRNLVKARLAENEGRATSSKAVARKKGRQPAKNPPVGQSDPTVADFMRTLKHPLKKDFEAARRILLSVDPSIQEGIKWKAPSFRTKDYFATLFLRSIDRVQFIFHFGAKVKDHSKAGVQVPDPAGLIEWLAKDRCIVTLGVGKELNANRAAFEAIVRRWIQLV